MFYAYVFLVTHLPTRRPVWRRDLPVNPGEAAAVPRSDRVGRRLALGCAALVVGTQIALRPTGGSGLWAGIVGSLPSALFVLGVPFLGNVARVSRARFAGRCLAVLLIALAYEGTQLVRTDRTFDPLDVIASVAGCLLSLVVFEGLRRLD